MIRVRVSKIFLPDPNNMKSDSNPFEKKNNRILFILLCGWVWIRQISCFCSCCICEFFLSHVDSCVRQYSFNLLDGDTAPFPSLSQLCWYGRILSILWMETWPPFPHSVSFVGTVGFFQSCGWSHGPLSPRRWESGCASTSTAPTVSQTSILR